jgi:hypothetical protein
MTVPNYDAYPKNVGILAMEMYFPKRVSCITHTCKFLY